ncbi:LysR family transcriptional regulator [Teredinibacter sp. KSP-S5-2]|uniref:LysR family transcriptional regulator n=1 Tax=Teredinibacter sp. KSP-S5-2 TaxID=3034506 RepID=UPI002934D43C|nr:LysR family transcriptional regulator [Teredinibacter sp. KSP-S5-2]WNO11413.1 LysR substrate-binding domain-containing protein [Teredinibacter sp. KSP-S5-2]
MNTDLLRTFLELSKTRHFGQTADNLYLTQSAVSFRIKQLEETFGVPLFTRERNNILLTSAGERLLPHAENILAAWQLALQDVGAAPTKNIQLALGSTSNLWDTFLQSILPKLATSFPNLFIRTEINTPQELTRALLAGRLDAIVLLDPPNTLEIETIKIGEIELALIASQPIHRIEDILTLGYVFVDWGTAFNLQYAKLFNEPIAPKLHTSQTHIALEFLLAHGGAAFLPVALVEPHINSGRLHTMQSFTTVSREVFAVFNKHSDHIQAIKPVVQLLTELELKPTYPMDNSA